MSIPIQCAGCQNTYSVPDAYAGKKVRCKSCAAIIAVPQEEDDDGPDLSLLEDTEPSRPAPAEAPRRSTPPPPPAQFDDEPYGAAPARDYVPPPSRGGSSFSAYAPKRSAGRGSYDPDVNSMSVTLLFGYGVLLLVGLIVGYYSTPLHKNVSLLFIPLAFLSSIISYFGVVALASWGAARLTFLMFGKPAPQNLFLRSAGVFILVVFTMLPFYGAMWLVGYLGRNGSLTRDSALPILISVLIAMGIVAILMAFWTHGRFFGTRPLQSLVILLLTFVFMFILVLPVSLLAGTVMLPVTPRGGFQAAMNRDADEPGRDPFENPVFSSNPRSSNTPTVDATPRPPRAEVDPLQLPLTNLRSRVSYVSNRFDRGMTPREALADDVQTLQASVKELADKYPDRTMLFSDLQQQTDRLVERLASVPSGKPGDAVFTEPMATETWTVAAAEPPAGEVSFLDFNLVPPAGAEPVLESANSAEPQWQMAKSRSKLTLKTTPATDPRQKQPWFAPDWLTSQAGQRLFALPTPNPETATVGKIGDLVFHRIETYDNNRTAINYLALDGNRWIVARIDSNTNGRGDIDFMESAVRTLRRRPAGEPKKSMIDTLYLVNRYCGEFGSAADETAGRLKADPAAEDVVLRQLTEGDPAQKEKLVKLLGDVGTAKSAPALWRMAESSDNNIRKSVRQTLRRVDPTKAGPITFAIVDLKSNDFFRTGDAVELLAQAEVDEKRRAEVDEVLAAALADPDFRRGNSREFNDAVAKWNGPKIRNRLVFDLGDERSRTDKKMAIKVLAASGDAKHIPLICRWILLQPEVVVEELIKIGPPAEAEVGKLLKEKNGKARLHAARVLEQIGTKKSMMALSAAAADARDPMAQTAAKSALATVKDRTKATTQPATTPSP